MNRNTGKSDWKDGFLFVGNARVLDFLNTRPVIDGKLTEMLADFPALLRWFAAAEILPINQSHVLRKASPTEQRHTLEGMQRFRERIRAAVLQWRQTGEVPDPVLRELNEKLAAHAIPKKLERAGGGLALATAFEPHKPQDLFAPIVESTAQLFAELDRGRVRQCDQCVLQFYDISKKGTRRWCSMQLCGNRQKVAAFAARKREH